MTTTTDVMQLFDYTLNGISSAEGVLSTHSHDLAAAPRSAVDTLVAERDALRTERDALRQVIEQQLLNVPVGEWKK